MQRLNRQFLSDIWAIAKPFWVSDQKWKAYGLFAAFVALTLFQVFLSVRFNIFYGAFWDAIQKYDLPTVVHQFWIFCFLATLYVSDFVYIQYLQQMLTIIWRRWMTDHYLHSWLAHKAYYRLQLIEGGTDNPDQRISEDLRDFPDLLLSLFQGVLNAVVTFCSFVGLLWVLTGSTNVPLFGGHTFTVHGYGLWVALIYSVIGTWLTLRIGGPLVTLFFSQQRFEADFRYSMVRLRENAESVAFFGGEVKETAAFLHFFQAVFNNAWAIVKRRRKVNFFIGAFGQLALIVPLLMALPLYFHKKILFGGIQQILAAFQQVQTSVSFIVDSNTYIQITQFQSIVARLATFRRHIEEVVPDEEEREAVRLIENSERFAVKNLRLNLPNGKLLLDHIDLDVGNREMVLLTGPSGSGKSTLLRAVARLWPFAEGEVSVNYKSPLFMPQRPYLPLGTLRNIMLYPHGSPEIGNEEIAKALTAVGLSKLAPEIDRDDNWSYHLSIGEQQRLNFARILLQHPDAIFMDEATSALDEEAEAELYRLLRGLPDRPFVLSIGHRSTIREFHDRILDLTQIGEGYQRAAPASA